MSQPGLFKFGRESSDGAFGQVFARGGADVLVVWWCFLPLQGMESIVQSVFAGLDTVGSSTSSSGMGMKEYSRRFLLLGGWWFDGDRIGYVRRNGTTPFQLVYVLLTSIKLLAG